MRSYLRGSLGNDYLKRLEKYPALLSEARTDAGICRSRITFAVQHQQEGYGHAVYQTKKFAAGEPVLLCLGDHLFRGRTISPYEELPQLTDAAGRKIRFRRQSHRPARTQRATAQSLEQRHKEQPRLIDVSLIIEKPAVETARENCGWTSLPDDVFFGWFGIHLLAPSIYDVLEEMIRDNVRDNGEFQLTRAQEIQRQREGYLALEMIDAQRFDFGVPDDFVRSVQEFRERNHGGQDRRSLSQILGTHERPIEISRVTVRECVISFPVVTTTEAIQLLEKFRAGGVQPRRGAAGISGRAGGGPRFCAGGHSPRVAQRFSRSHFRRRQNSGPGGENRGEAVRARAACPRDARHRRTRPRAAKGNSSALSITNWRAA